jgi:hypothetical protein
MNASIDISSSVSRRAKGWTTDESGFDYWQRLFFSESSKQLWVPPSPSLLLSGFQNLFLRSIKRQRLEADYSRPPSVGIKNGGVIPPFLWWQNGRIMKLTTHIASSAKVKKETWIYEYTSTIP